MVSTDTSKDVLLGELIEGVSRAIDMHTHRWFFPFTQTNWYTPGTPGGNTPAYASELLVDDLLSVTTLTTDQDGDDVYETTWAGTDYTLGPYNAASAPNIPGPYYEIKVLPYGHFRFPVWPRAVAVSGTWGYYNVLETALATLGAAISTTTATTITLSAAPDVGTGQTLLIDSEQLFISALTGTTATVVRGVNGTTAATHLNGAAIQVQTYPSITDACLFQVGLDYIAAESGGEVRGGGQFASTVPGGGLHPFAQRRVAPFVRDAFG